MVDFLTWKVKSPSHVVINNAFVIRQHRGHGLFRQMYQKLVDEKFPAPTLFSLTSTDESMLFYRRIGWHQFQYSPFQHSHNSREFFTTSHIGTQALADCPSTGAALAFCPEDYYKTAQNEYDRQKVFFKVALDEQGRFLDPESREPKALIYEFVCPEAPMDECYMALYYNGSIMHYTDASGEETPVHGKGKHLFGHSENVYKFNTIHLTQLKKECVAKNAKEWWLAATGRLAPGSQGLFGRRVRPKHDHPGPSQPAHTP